MASPTVKVYCYGPVVRGASSSFSTCFSQLEEVKRQVCVVLCFQVAMSLILGNWILIFTTSVVRAVPINTQQEKRWSSNPSEHQKNAQQNAWKYHNMCRETWTLGSDTSMILWYLVILLYHLLLFFISVYKNNLMSTLSSFTGFVSLLFRGEFLLPEQQTCTLTAQIFFLLACWACLHAYVKP